MITSDIISNSSDHLNDVARYLLETLIKESKVYSLLSKVQTLNITAAFDAAEGTVKARILNALLKEIDKLGVGVVAIKGDRDGVHWSQYEEREALVREAFILLFDNPDKFLVYDENGNPIVPPQPTGGVGADGNYGYFAVGIRSYLCRIHGKNSCSCFPPVNYF